eukprot:CAMPEP_0118852580 /NCGR_PEP_ID=MMETSP1163-20130328/1523_1 /TAXON_ID=124430 /ORGANISM="Phaeomonas parva, Strain CCMP2877" /LENGTH=66 /DNA_ID=CAMNT_0006785019 /DNA_START=256 /DNA_END=452 /DNA_ORIENTATION=-
MAELGGLALGEGSAFQRVEADAAPPPPPQQQQQEAPEDERRLESPQEHAETDSNVSGTTDEDRTPP